MTLRDPVNERATAQSITGEAHTIGEDFVDQVWLDELPLDTDAVTITGFTQIAAGAPAVGEFRCDYAIGRLVFNTSDADTDITIDYTGTGSGLSAHQLVRIHSILDGRAGVEGQVWHPEATLSIVSGTPSTVDWDLSAAQTAVLNVTEACTINAPTNLQAGATYMLRLTTDATGGYTLTWNAVFDFGSEAAPDGPATGEVTLVSFYCDGANLLATSTDGYSA